MRTEVKYTKDSDTQKRLADELTQSKLADLKQNVQNLLDIYNSMNESPCFYDILQNYKNASKIRLETRKDSFSHRGGAVLIFDLVQCTDATKQLYVPQWIGNGFVFPLEDSFLEISERENCNCLFCEIRDKCGRFSCDLDTFLDYIPAERKTKFVEDFKLSRVLKRIFIQKTIRQTNNAMELKYDA